MVYMQLLTLWKWTAGQTFICLKLHLNAPLAQQPPTAAYQHKPAEKLPEQTATVSLLQTWKINPDFIII